MVKIVFSAVFNILSVYVDFRIIHIFLEKKKKKEILLIIYPIICIINWGIYFLWNQFYLTMGSLFIGLLVAAVVLYEGRLVQKMMAVISAMALGLISEDIVW